MLPYGNLAFAALDDAKDPIHEPVLPLEVLRLLENSSRRSAEAWVVDGTLGAGGHAALTRLIDFLCATVLPANMKTCIDLDGLRVRDVFASSTLSEQASLYKELLECGAGMARRMGVPAGDRDDLVQDAFASLLESNTPLRTGMKMQPFFAGIVAHKVLRARRRWLVGKEHLVSNEMLAVAMVPVEAVEEAMFNIYRAQLREALGDAIRRRLRGLQRQVAQADFEAGMVNTSELACELGCTEGAVRKARERYKVELRADAQLTEAAREWARLLEENPGGTGGMGGLGSATKLRPTPSTHMDEEAIGTKSCGGARADVGALLEAEARTDTGTETLPRDVGALQKAETRTGEEESPARVLSELILALRSLGVDARKASTLARRIARAQELLAESEEEPSPAQG